MIKPVKAGVYYWVGGTGNWSQFNTHWATTSGGLVFHIQTPTFADTVIFDANSFSAPGQTVFVDSTFITCKNMDWSAVTNNPTFATSSGGGNFDLYGSLTLSPNMTWNYNGTTNYLATSGNQTITSGGHNLNYMMFQGAAQWLLQDSLNCAYLSLTNGTLRT
ncbi:MAG: hypothetical protein ACXVPF_14360, partial [Bacteroidia bacterium]